MIVNYSGKDELTPARLVRPGSKLTVMNDKGSTVLDEVIDVSPADPSSFSGLANIVTSTETIVVNGIVGSMYAESSMKGFKFTCYKTLKVINDIAGARVARAAYRGVEMAFY